MSLKTSVIVCTYTERRLALLGEGIAGVRAQQPPPDEIVVVVDHNSPLAARLRDDHPDLVVVENERTRGLSGARNTGVSVAAGDVVVFLDDDAVPRDGWLRELIAPFADPTITGTGGRAEPRWETAEGPEWLPEELYWVIGCSFRGQAGGDVRNPIGCSMAFRKDAVVDAGGFSCELGRVGTLPVGCEETELGLRINRRGGRIVLTGGSVVDHFVPAERTTLSYVLRRCYSEGLSKAIVRRLAADDGGTEATLAPEVGYLATVVLAIVRTAVRGARARSVGTGAGAALLPACLAWFGAGFVRGTVAWRR